MIPPKFHGLPAKLHHHTAAVFELNPQSYHWPGLAPQHIGVGRVRPMGGKVVKESGLCVPGQDGESMQGVEYA